MKLKYKFITDACPVQAEGTINGEPFFFRARWQIWRMTIGKDPYTIEVLPGQWRRSGICDDASWMPLDGAKRIIEQCAKEYLDAS